MAIMVISVIFMKFKKIFKKSYLVTTLMKGDIQVIQSLTTHVTRHLRPLTTFMHYISGQITPRIWTPPYKLKCDIGHFLSVKSSLLHFEKKKKLATISQPEEFTICPPQILVSLSCFRKNATEHFNFKPTPENAWKSHIPPLKDMQSNYSTLPYMDAPIKLMIKNIKKCLELNKAYTIHNQSDFKKNIVTQRTLTNKL